MPPVKRELPPLDRELLVAYIAMKFGDGFCCLDAVQELGDIQVKSLSAYSAKLLTPLLDLANKAVDDNITVVEIQKLQKAGYSKQAIEEVISVAALFRLANRMVTEMGPEAVQLDDGQQNNVPENGRDQNGLLSVSVSAKGYMLPKE